MKKINTATIYDQGLTWIQKFDHADIRSYGTILMLDHHVIAVVPITALVLFTYNT